MSILYILIALLLLGILVTVHEWGHFISARLLGIEVMEFSIGMGPLLFSHTGKSGTKFSLRAIPVGGFCAFYGEDDVKGDYLTDERAYNRQPVWKRMISVLMGPGMNFLLAFVVLIGWFWIGGVQEVTSLVPQIIEVSAASPAQQAGILPGDIVEMVNGVDMSDTTLEKLSQAISGWKEGDAPLAFSVRRGEDTVLLQVTPARNPDTQEYRVGITYQAMILSAETRAIALTDAISLSWRQCVSAGRLILDALRNLVTTGEGLDQTSGPVGVVSMVSQEVREYGFSAFLNLLVVISINLGIMNLLPIPGLDGSRFLFMLVEAIRGKSIAPQREAVVHLVGFVFLMALMVFFTWQDIQRLLH